MEIYSLRMYISMKTVVRASTGLSVFISVFSTVIQTSENVKINDKKCTVVFRLALGSAVLI